MQKPNKAEIAAKHWFETMAARQRLEEEGATKRRGERSDPVIEGWTTVLSVDVEGNERAEEEFSNEEGEKRESVTTFKLFFIKQLHV